MATRESPYPQLGTNGQPVPQKYEEQAYAPQQEYAPQPPQNQYAPPPSAPPPQQQQQPYQMQPANNYAQQQPPPQQPQYGNNGYGNGYGGEKVQPLEVVKPKWNDLVFALLFLAQFFGHVALGVISLRALPASSSTGGSLGSSGTSVTLDSSTAYLLAIICGAGLLFSILLLGLVRMFARAILEICLVLNVVFTVAYAVYMWYEKYYSGAIIFTLFAVLAVFSYFGMRRRIPFSKQILLFVLRIAKAHKSVYLLALLGTTIQAAYCVWWSFATVAIYQNFNPDSAGSETTGSTSSNGAVIGLVVFSLFSFYYTTQFLTNYFLTIIAGIYGSYYFGSTGKVTWGAFKRSSTYSLGSIAFGSLIVALLDLIRALLQILQSYDGGDGSAIGTAVICVAQCCVGCIAGLVSYFNRYAYIEIALYGKSYLNAAKDTWRLMKDRGIDALVNDCLINNIWTFGSIAVGALTSAFAYIYVKAVGPSWSEGSNVVAVLVGYAFIIGFQITHSLGNGALSSGASTLFVALAEDPMMLAERDPQLFETIRQTYPQVVTPV